MSLLAVDNVYLTSHSFCWARLSSEDVTGGSVHPYRESRSRDPSCSWNKGGKIERDDDTDGSGCQHVEAWRWVGYVVLQRFRACRPLQTGFERKYNKPEIRVESLGEPSHGRGAPEVPEPPTLGAQYLTRYNAWKKIVRATRPALVCASP